MPKVSVVMSVYNSETYLDEAIESILRQTFGDFEFIIVDDGSTDASVSIVERYSQTDSRIRFFKLGENRGLSVALNHGIEQVHGDYIARMDSDDISFPSRFERQIHYLEHHPNVGVLGGQMQVIDVDKKPLFVFEVPQVHGLIVWNLFFGRTFAHPTVMMRRGLLEKVGGYDANVPVAQDIDLWSRMIGEAQFANLSDELMLYRTHHQATSIQKTEQQKIVLFETVQRLLKQLWHDVSNEIVIRFLKVRSGQSQFGEQELKELTSDATRLLDSMLEMSWIAEDDRYLILEDMERRFNLFQPRKTSRWRRWLGR